MGLFAADEHQDDCDNDADNDTCGQGKIEGKILALVVDITGKASDPRHFSGKQDEASHACYDETDNKENLAEAGKIDHTSPLGSLHRKHFDLFFNTST
jgi:hypothetical protein